MPELNGAFRAEYSDYIAPAPSVLKSDILVGAHSHTAGFYWHPDSDERIPGGRKRTYLPAPNNVVDGILMGGNEQFRMLMQPCLSGAEALMRDRGAIDWRVNRVVLNYMPPNVLFKRHIDPPTYRDGVVTIGLGSAAVTLDEAVVHTGEGSLMVIPPDLPHSIQNDNAVRISLALMCDTRLEAGGSVTGERVRNALTGIRHSGMQALKKAVKYSA